MMLVGILEVVQACKSGFDIKAIDKDTEVPMIANTFRPKHGLAILTVFLAPAVTFAMSGMDMPHGGHGKLTSSLSKSMGEPINSPESEIEVTYSADGKTVIFVSGRQEASPHQESPTTSISGCPTT
jgi:hypothetical protein